jgi:hypothetical protein
MKSSESKRVLIIGVYLPSIANNAIQISTELRRSDQWLVDLRWATVGGGGVPSPLGDLTLLEIPDRLPKFAILNRLLSGVDLKDYRFLVVVDDDIELPPRFLDRFLAYQSAYDLTLCQPARTHDSYIDHHFVAQLLGVAARQTRFVEIGPVFSISHEGFDVLLPFDEAAPMGWGLDFTWPAQLESRGYRLGIIDATPVRHALRKPVTTYDYDVTNQAMKRFLAGHAHLSHADAFVAIETFPLTDREHGVPACVL